MKIEFGNWPAEMHSDFEQVKRMESSKKVAKEIIKFDEQGKSITVKGSSATPYETTLYECTCADFAMRQAPCKHIYCLARKLGLLEGLPKYDKKKSTFKPADEAKRYLSLYEAGDISADTYVNMCAVLKKVK